MIRKVVAAIFAALNVFLIPIITGLKSPNSLPAISAIAVLIASLIQVVGEFMFLEFPLRFSWSRRILMPESAIEGYWEQVIYGKENNNKSFVHYAYVCIEYDEDSGKFGYYGLSYQRIETMDKNLVDKKESHPDLELRACFEATEVHVVKINSVIKLNDQFSAIIYPKTHNPSQDSCNDIKSNFATGYASFSFYSDKRNKHYNRGNGRFLDNTGETIKGFQVTLTRISQKKFDEQYLKYKDKHDAFHKDLAQVIENIVEDNVPDLKDFRNDKKG